MKNYQPEQIRNIGIVGHGGEGKTTVTEAMLFHAGVTDRMGRVEDGSTVTDYDPEETKRQISISTALAPFEWKGAKVNVLDIPGYFDFVAEMTGALKAADGALIVISALSGITVGAEKAWDACERGQLPRMFFINQMDREHIDYDKVLNAVQERFGPTVVPVQLPIMKGGMIAGAVDLLSGKAVEFGAKGAVKEVPTPDTVAVEVEHYREAIMEAVAGADDALMEKYFEEGVLTHDEMLLGLRKGIGQGVVVPVLLGAAVGGLNIGALMDMMVNFMPSPKDRDAAQGVNPRSGEEEQRVCDPSAPFSAQIFKTVADPFVGKLSLFRVMSGTLTSDMSVYNPNTEKNEKAGSLYFMRGKKQVSCDKLMAGDIGALAKLQYTMTGHTLCDAAKPIQYADIEFPKPCISLAVTAKKQGEEEKIASGLNRLAEEDPSFTVAKDTETGDMLISGLGELHLEVLTRKLQNKFGVEAVLVDPKIPYRETIRKAVKAEGRHKKQSGGHGQFGHVWIEFEPITDGSAEFEFVDKVVGGVVPRQYIPAVEKGLRENIRRGVLAGCPVVGLRATLYDGSYHSVDSSEMAFKTAARLAFKKGCQAANPVLLEPIYQYKVVVPDEYMGDIIGDMNRRRGRILGMNPMSGLQEVVAEAPMAEMFKYATDLRSMTQARGSFTAQFSRYEEVPANIAAKVVEAIKQDDEDEE